jgi:hypothetical protein
MHLHAFYAFMHFHVYSAARRNLDSILCSVLAAERLGQEAHASFLDNTYLGDRATTIRQYLDLKPDIMEELPPPELAARYGG